MPTKPTLSSWKPISAHEIEAKQARYTPDVILDLAEISGIAGDEKLGHLGFRVLEIARSAASSLRIESRPGVTERREAIKVLRNHLRKTIDSINYINSDSRRMLENESAGGLLTESNTPDISFFLFGKLRVDQSISSMTLLDEWCRRALSQMPPAQPRKPARTAALEAVVELAALWHELTGTQPTRKVVSTDVGAREVGSFRAFASTALEPLGVRVSDDLTKRAVAVWHQRQGSAKRSRPELVNTWVNFT